MCETNTYLNKDKSSRSSSTKPKSRQNKIRSEREDRRLYLRGLGDNVPAQTSPLSGPPIKMCVRKLDHALHLHDLAERSRVLKGRRWLKKISVGFGKEKEMRRNILPQKEICGIELKRNPNFNLTTKHEEDERKSNRPRCGEGTVDLEGISFSKLGQ